MLRGRSKRRYEFDTEQMLPMSVDTIASSGIARSSSRSICRGCMCCESRDTSTDHASFSCVQPSSSLLPGALLARDRRRARASWLAWQASDLPARRAISARAAALASPQMPTEIGFTSPSIFASASIWMIFAFFGQ